MELLPGHVRNLLAVLGQSNDTIEDKLSVLTTHGDLGCMKDNLVQELCRVLEAVRYHTFKLPCEWIMLLLHIMLNQWHSQCLFQ